ncbi:glutathione S-transferase U9-like [Silene latifolia]|uniref:glutathione S-transferase U9-like n=1 Tax=Silene latifolia TaxID=37657 RepID=UPI003D7862C3
MTEESSVKLHGSWASPFAMRALLALKVKGIDFEYIEEDLSNKSESLLKYNPVYKKVPVLVHNGKPISESLVVLEYIDEVWTDPPHLLPKDPYLRAKHRFWAAFFEPLLETIFKTLMTEGEAQKTTLDELLEKMDVAEQGLKEIFPNGVPSFQEQKPGYLDIVFYSLYGIHEAADEMIGTKFLTVERFPLLLSWVTALKQVPEVNQVTPSIPKLVGFLHFLRQRSAPTKA